jgi:HAMP domain-containing protein
MGLRLKFNLVMLLVLLLGLGLDALYSYVVLSDNARREVLGEAAIMMSQADVISRYTDREIAPLLAEQSREHFLPQIIPFWVAQTNFRALQAQFPDYSFREPATNPTNPADRPTQDQADIIDVFARQPQLQEFVSERPGPTGPILQYSRPIRVADNSCLVCHSTPAAAPASMVERYGSANGFGWKFGDLVGAQIVSVPMRLPLDRANATFRASLIGLGLAFALMTLVLNVLLHITILRPVRRIVATANAVSLGNRDAAEIDTTGSDEIAALAASFNRMRKSLDHAMDLLS